MKIIVYKMRSKYYECVDIKDDGGDDVKIIFDQPLCGSLVIGDSILPLIRGVCKADVGSLPEGECRPTIFVGAKSYKIESFFIKDGIILRHSPDGEYIRELCENYAKLEKRVNEIETRLENINDKIIQKIKF